MTLATDYALAALTGVLGMRIAAGNASQACRRHWAVAFLALALGAGLGGSYHGFSLEVLWKPTLLIIGVAGFAMVAGSASATLQRGARRVLTSLAALQLAGFALWVMFDDRYLAVIADTGLALLVVAMLHGRDARSAASRWILAGVALSLAAALVQASGIALHRNFNHNDAYHVLQAGAMLLYFRGVMRLLDRG